MRGEGSVKRRATAHGGGAEESKAVLRAPELHDGGGGGGGGAGGPYGPDGPEGRAMYGAEAQRRKIGRARGGGLRDHSIAMGTAPAGVDESAAAGCSPTRSGAIAGVQDYGVGRWRDGGVSRVVRNPGAGRPVPATTDRRQRGLGHAASTGLRIAAAALFLGTALVWWVGGPSELLRMAKGGQAFAARRNGYDAQKAAQAWMDGLPPVRVAATSPDPMHPEWDAAGWRASERFDGAKPRVAPAVTLVTAAAASQWAQLVNLVGSIHAHDAAARVVVWDMGLLAYQQAAITCWEGVVLRKFPYSSYPPHVKVAYTQAATAMVWRETAAAFPDDDWLWLDPAMEVRGGLDAVRLAIARDGFFLAAAMHGDAAAGSGLDPHPSMVSALGLSNSDAAALGARPRVSPRVLGLGAASRTIHVPAYTPPEGLAPTHPGAARNGGGTELWARRGAGVHGTGLALAGTAREPTWTAIEVLPDDVPLGDVGTGEGVRHRLPGLVLEYVLRCAVVTSCIAPHGSTVRAPRRWAQSATEGAPSLAAGASTALSLVTHARGIPVHVCEELRCSSAVFAGDAATATGDLPRALTWLLRGSRWPKPFAAAVGLSDGCRDHAEAAGAAGHALGWGGGGEGINARLARAEPDDTEGSLAAAAAAPAPPAAAQLMFGSPTVQRNAEGAGASDVERGRALRVVDVPASAPGASQLERCLDDGVASTRRDLDCAAAVVAFCHDCHARYCRGVRNVALEQASPDEHCSSWLCTAVAPCGGA